MKDRTEDRTEDMTKDEIEYTYTIEQQKKRGRKKKVVENEENSNILHITESSPYIKPEAQEPAKKRGRKPKGGKIIMKPTTIENDVPIVPNIILHLKCSMDDLLVYQKKMTQYVSDPLQYNPAIPPHIMTYNMNNTPTFSIYEKEQEKTSTAKTSIKTSIKSTIEEIEDTTSSTLAYKEDAISTFEKVPVLCSVCSCNTNMEIHEKDNEISNKEMNMKLNKLKIQLYKNGNPDKKSACFWCTYDYDNQTCYIPKYEADGQMYGYGSFCRPECAVAYLMKENIDDTIKFERYNLLNYLYGKIYDYKKNIKPAPNPFYLLEKYYGNLTIQEYRKLLKSEHMLVVLEKPMTRILPELHEDNEDITTNIYGSNNRMKGSVTTNGGPHNASIGGGGGSSGGGQYKVKRQSEKQKGPSKTSIMKDNFGFQ
jgi:uncharacterized membrane protein YgcG